MYVYIWNNNINPISPTTTKIQLKANHNFRILNRTVPYPGCQGTRYKSWVCAVLPQRNSRKGNKRSTKSLGHRGGTMGRLRRVSQIRGDMQRREERKNKTKPLMMSTKQKLQKQTQECEAVFSPIYTPTTTYHLISPPLP